MELRSCSGPPSSRCAAARLCALCRCWHAQGARGALQLLRFADVPYTSEAGDLHSQFGLLAALRDRGPRGGVVAVLATHLKAKADHEATRMRQAVLACKVARARARCNWTRVLRGVCAGGG